MLHAHGLGSKKTWILPFIMQQLSLVYRHELSNLSVRNGPLSSLDLILFSGAKSATEAKIPPVRAFHNEM